MIKNKTVRKSAVVTDLEYSTGTGLNVSFTKDGSPTITITGEEMDRWESFYLSKADLLPLAKILIDAYKELEDLSDE